MSADREKALLVTGGRGFIGRHLVHHLLAAQSGPVISIDVAPLDQQPSNSRQMEMQRDVCDRASMHEVFSQFDVSTIFDLASVTEVGLPKNEYESNLRMTKTLVDFVQRFDIKKYVFYSTQLVFRKEGKVPSHDRDYNPIDDYGTSKIESEEWIKNNLSKERRLILRPTYIWGEGHRRFRDGFLYRVAKGQMMLPAGDNVLRYYGYVGTVCKQAAVLAARPLDTLPSQIFYLSDEPISMRKFCEYFIEALGIGAVRPIPAPILRGLGRIGNIAGALGAPFPIRALQANEMTRSYPVPIERTLALTGTSTDYKGATAAVAAWALSDPQFRTRIGR